MAEDGTVLSFAICSSDEHAIYDLQHDRFRSIYDKHYPLGYSFEYVTYSNKEWHTGLQLAIYLNGTSP